MSIANITDSAVPISESDLIELEKKFGFVFPEEIRNFYLTTNGGVPSRGIFRKAGDEFLVNEFLPIKYGQYGLRLEDIYQSLAREGDSSFPAYLVPIGMDAGGDFFCFGTRPNELGTIYIYRNEYYDNETEAVIMLSESMSHFLENLTVD